MTRPSPQTDRLRWLLSALAARPRDSMTLAQIARHLDVSKATCLPMVAALTSAGWLVRDPRTKTYRLGPALIEIGRAAEQAAAADVLLPAFMDLSRRAGLQVVVFESSGQHLVLADVIGRNGPAATWAGMARGHRFRPFAPLGACLVAWGGDDEVDRWLAAGGSTDVEHVRALCLPALAAVRDRGYAVELRDDMQHEVFQLIQRLRSRQQGAPDTLLSTLTRRALEHLAEHDYLVTSIDPDATYRPISINAPVFGPYGDVELIVCLVDSPPDIPGREVVHLGEMVRESVHAVTTALRGSFPADWPGGAASPVPPASPVSPVPPGSPVPAAATAAATAAAPAAQVVAQCDP